MRRKTRRAREGRVEQKALDHTVGGHASGVARLVRLECEAGLQHSGPLERVFRSVGEVGRFVGHDVGDVCRAFEELAQAHKIARLVVEHRVLEQTVDQADAHLHVHQKLVQVWLPDRFLDPPVERIDLLVQLARKRWPHGLSRKPGGGDARADRRTKRARDDHLHGLVPLAGVARAPAGQLHEPDPEIRPGFVRPVEG